MTSPIVPQPPPLSYHSPLAQDASAIWRDGYLLVATKGAHFPERCVKCNAPSVKVYRRKLTWHHPLIYLILLANLLIYAIVAMAVQKKGTVYIGLCDAHRSRRLILGSTGWLLFIMAIVCTFLAISLESATFGFLIIFCILGALVMLVIVSRFVTVDHIDDRYIYLKNVNKEFLLSLPAAAPPPATLDRIVVQHLQQRP